MTIDFSGKDRYKDKWEVTGYDPFIQEDGSIYLDLHEGDNVAGHILTPKKARKLANALLEAADYAEAIAL